MREALNTSTSTLHDARELDRLSDSERAMLRGTLACPSCLKTAYFRARGSDGRAACFFARHDDECQLASPEWETHAAAGQQDIAAIDNSGEIKVLRLDPFAQGPAPHAGRHQTGAGASGHARHHTHSAGTRTRDSHSQGLRPFHRAIEQDARLASGPDLIKLPDANTPMPLSRALLRPHQIGPSDLDTHRLVWGSVRHINETPKDVAFLISVRRDDDSGEYHRSYYTRLSPEAAQELLSHHGWSRIDAAAGGRFLAYGLLRADVHGTPFISINSAEALSIITH